MFNLQKAIDKIESCRNTTAYSSDDIQLMKSRVPFLLGFLSVLNNTYYIFDEKETHNVEKYLLITNIVYGHNSLVIQFNEFFACEYVKILLQNNKISVSSTGFGGLVILYDPYTKFSI